MSKKLKILIADDDKQIADFIYKSLSRHNIDSDIANDGKEALFLITTNNYDVIILDCMMPYLDGISLLKIIRKQDIQTPVIILSALDDTSNKIEGFEAGSDDYITKPFSIDELIVRIKSICRRLSMATQQITKIVCQDLVLDEIAHKVTRDGIDIPLQAREYKILHLLLKHKNEVVSRNMLLKEVWDYSFDPQTNVVEVHISRLRNKLNINDKPDLIITVRGFGYVIKDRD
ncbi:response regulator transcription factor [Pseudofrancisella aestuarii]|uniref:Response regulator transcription factor n=1 Tax=Pseudofrancisella aestuarii TaxID=2670347 RepID=A0ABV9TA91_9GAMM|nr:response regulator transcription factor [Pseudofrancisella aestuarii]